MGLNYQAAGCQTETRKGGKLPMAESIFMRVSEVAEELGVSQSYAYKLVRQLNKELAETGLPIHGTRQCTGSRGVHTGKGCCHLGEGFLRDGVTFPYAITVYPVSTQN